MQVSCNMGKEDDFEVALTVPIAPLEKADL